MFRRPFDDGTDGLQWISSSSHLWSNHHNIQSLVDNNQNFSLHKI